MPSCPYVFEISYLGIYAIGLTFVYNSALTEHMGLTTLAFGTALLFIHTTYNVHQLGRFDIIGFSLFASLALLLSSFVLVLLFYNRIHGLGKDMVGNPAVMPLLARDILTIFESLFIAIFVFLTLLVVLFLRNASTPSAQKVAGGSVPLITKLLFSLGNGGLTLSKEEKEQRGYILTATPFSIVLLSLTSYCVYIANVLQYVR
jgi:hypothetical protein